MTLWCVSHRLLQSPQVLVPRCHLKKFFFNYMSLELSAILVLVPVELPVPDTFSVMWASINWALFHYKIFIAKFEAFITKLAILIQKLEMCSHQNHLPIDLRKNVWQMGLIDKQLVVHKLQVSLDVLQHFWKLQDDNSSTSCLFQAVKPCRYPACLRICRLPSPGWAWSLSMAFVGIYRVW